MNIYIKTYGCQMNERDSEALAGMLCARGHKIVPDEDSADVMIFNTCSVRDQAERKAVGKVSFMKKYKDRKPGLIIGVIGCMAERRGESLLEEIKHLDFVLGTGKLHTLPDLIESLREKRLRRADTGPCNDVLTAMGAHYRPEGGSNVLGQIAITRGCNRFCSYCIVPYVRGRERSRQPEDILAECRAVIEAGAKEITLLGQNVNSYGKDLNCGMDFADLLEQIAQIPGEFLIRFMTSHPRDASFKLFDTMAKYDKIAKQLHLPFQSGSSRVLKAMNRHYDRETYLSKVNYAKSVMPDLVLTSDVIVGFPGETEEEFEETISLIEAVHYDSLFTFIFSPRPGTPAAKMEDPTPKEEKSRRFDRLCDVQNRISVEIHNNYIGKQLRCLVDGKDKDMLTARTEGGRLVRFAGCDSLIGTYQNVTITGATTWSLIGEMQK